jgi:hypothetical protein
MVLSNVRTHFASEGTGYTSVSEEARLRALPSAVFYHTGNTTYVCCPKKWGQK